MVLQLKKSIFINHQLGRSKEDPLFICFSPGLEGQLGEDHFQFTRSKMQTRKKSTKKTTIRSE